MKQKTCTKCENVLPANSDNFYKRKDSKDGLRSDCKQCFNYKSKLYANRNKEKIKEYQAWYHRTNKEQIREQRKEYREKNADAIKEKKRIYHQENKVYINDRVKKYYEGNKERVLAYQRWYNDEFRHKVVKYKRRYYLSNMDEVKSKAAQWGRDNPEKKRKLARKYKARKRNLIADLTDEQWETCKEYFNHSCCYCGEQLPLEQEHFIPVSKGGHYSADNIIPACRSCNASKNNSVFSDWYKSCDHYSEERENKILTYLRYGVTT